MRKHMCQLATVAAAAMLGALTSNTQASQILYEGFDQPVTTPPIADQQVTLNSNWILQSYGNFSTYHAVVGTGLSYPGVTAVGGSADLYECGLIQSVTLPADFYVSVLVHRTNSQGYLGINLSEGHDMPAVAGFGVNWGATELYASAGNYAQGGNTNTASASYVGTTALLVAHIDGANKTLTVWDYATPSNTASYTYSNANPIGGVNIASGWGATGSLDEVKIGTTLADVTPIPEPASLMLLGASSLLVLRRRRA